MFCKAVCLQRRLMVYWWQNHVEHLLDIRRFKALICRLSGVMDFKDIVTMSSITHLTQHGVDSSIMDWSHRSAPWLPKTPGWQWLTILWRWLLRCGSNVVETICDYKSCWLYQDELMLQHWECGSQDAIVIVIDFWLMFISVHICDFGLTLLNRITANSYSRSQCHGQAIYIYQHG